MAYGMFIEQEMHRLPCMLGCVQRGPRNASPAVTRSHVIREDRRNVPQRACAIVPTLCMHCENAPCIAACAVEGATYKREDGIVMIDKEKCIGCKACIAACRTALATIAKANRAISENSTSMKRDVSDLYAPWHGRPVRVRGARRRRRRPSASSRRAPPNARYFGDLDDIKAKAEAEGGYELLPEEGTNPLSGTSPAR